MERKNNLLKGVCKPCVCVCVCEKARGRVREEKLMLLCAKMAKGICAVMERKREREEREKE